MAVTDEIFRLRYQAEGEAAIKRAQDELRRLEAAADRAAQKFREGTLDEQRFGRATEVLGQKIAAARSSLDGYERAARGGGGTRNIGMAALEAGRALEDLNYGLVGVMNNIPQLAMALGAGAGLTGVIGILGAAVLFLSRNWEKVAGAFAVGIPNDTISSLDRARGELEKINGELDKLAKTERISIADKIRIGTLRLKREDLERQVADAEAVDSLFGGQSDRAKEVAGIVSRVVANSGMARDDLTRLITGGVAELGGPGAIGMPGLGLADAGRQLAAGAQRGDEASARQLARALEASGPRGAALARQIGSGLSGQPSGADFGPTRETFDAAMADREQETLRLRADAARADDEARKAAVETALGSVVGLDARIEQGLRNRLQAGMSRAQAGGEVAANLLAEMQAAVPSVPREWLEDAAKDAVRTRGRAMREAAAASAPMTAEGRELERLGLMRAQLDHADLMRGPRAGPSTLGIEAFAQQVQAAGAKDPTELIREHIAKTESLIKLQERQNQLIERGGLLGA